MAYSTTITRISPPIRPAAIASSTISETCGAIGVVGGTAAPITSSWPSGRVVAPVVSWMSSSAIVLAICAAFAGSASWARIVRIRVVSLAVARTFWPSLIGSAMPASWAVD